MLVKYGGPRRHRRVAHVRVTQVAVHQVKQGIERVNGIDDVASVRRVRAEPPPDRGRNGMIAETGEPEPVPAPARAGAERPGHRVGAVVDDLVSERGVGRQARQPGVVGMHDLAGQRLGVDPLLGRHLPAVPAAGAAPPAAGGARPAPARPRRRRSGWRRPRRTGRGSARVAGPRPRPASRRVRERAVRPPSAVPLQPGRLIGGSANGDLRPVAHPLPQGHPRLLPSLSHEHAIRPVPRGSGQMNMPGRGCEG